MIIVDQKLKDLERRGEPIRIGLVGAGFAGRGFALQLLSGIPGMRLAALSNRTTSYAKQAFKDAGVNKFKKVDTQEELEKAIKKGGFAFTNDAMLICKSKLIDVVVDATYDVEFGAKVALEAIKNKKHIVVINVEMDSTIGPILKKYADKAGVIYTQANGDQPGVLMNLYREVEGLGFKPVMAGNIKSLIDVRRTPETQKAFAEAHFQRPTMITSFADGTKISVEMATIANGTGFKVGKRGMYGPKATRVEEAPNLFSKEELLNGGLVDYILGAEPSFGVFILGYSDHPLKQRYMSCYKMGEGPIYTFYRPYHLSPLEAPMSVARAVLFKDVTLAAIAGPVADVVALAKKDLKKGDVLDGVGGFTCYGVIDNYETARAENLLPIGLSDGCILKKDISIDTSITFADVELPKGRLSDKLWRKQLEVFGKDGKKNEKK